VRSKENNKRTDSGQAGELTAKEFVQSLNPDAFCATYTTPEPGRFYIVGVYASNWSIPMYETEEAAWEAARDILNKSILRKLAL